MVFYLSIVQEILTLLTRVTSVRLDIFNFMQEKYYARILFVHTKKLPINLGSQSYKALSGERSIVSAARD